MIANKITLVPAYESNVKTITLLLNDDEFEKIINNSEQLQNKFDSENITLVFIYKDGKPFKTFDTYTTWENLKNEINFIIK